MHTEHSYSGGSYAEQALFSDPARVLTQLTRLIETQRQVAHDIKSPLAVVNTLVSTMGDIPHDVRECLLTALGRIKEIADDLKIKGQELDQRVALEDVNLFETLRRLVDEKQVQFCESGAVSVNLDPEQQKNQILIKAIASDLKRVLSNLMNNAIEALEGSGRVDVSLSYEQGQARVIISDTGKGMAPEVLQQITKKGATFNKNGGSGLGLYHARKCVEMFQGTLNIKSTPQQGTTVTLVFPCSGFYVQSQKIEDGFTVTSV